MSAIELNSKVIETKEVPLSELHFDINKDLKRISEHAERALATSFLRRGIINPFTVWVDGNGKNQVLDGWHRYSVLEKCAKQGLDVYLNADLFEQLKALLAERPAPASDDMAGLLQLQWQGGLMAALVAGLMPLPILFMIGFAVAIMINHPSVGEQKAFLSRHAGNVLADMIAVWKQRNLCSAPVPPTR